ncbi:uncharacterized protein LOC120351162 [Nilaparvata lugens]|uniref:uncharacterized protein LOC120351162 n=1 Tax=Nilaparvata lugens TaxID=108931 RepID=UPI00193E4A4F|nr:uncharacterized protein LOC120351162 [Nilaparvata lugens]
MAKPINYTFYLCLLVIGVSALWEEIAGPYDVSLSHMTHCDKRGPVSFLEPLKARKLNRTHLVCSGIFTVAVDLDKNVKFKIVAANKGTNGRYNNVVDIELEACDFIYNFGRNIVKSIDKHCNITYECPHKKFTCEMKNWVVNYDFVNVPALPYGEYRLDGSLLKLDQYNRRELISCARFYGFVTPKKPQFQKKTSSRNNTKTY